MYRVCTRPEIRFAGWSLSQQLSLSQKTLKLPGHGGTGVDQADVRRNHPREQWLEERIVRAPQDQRIAAGCQQGVDVMLQQLIQGRTVQITRLDQFNQARTRLRDDSHIGGETVEQSGELGALQGAGGGQHTDDTAAGRGSRRLDRRLHPDDGPMGEITA